MDRPGDHVGGVCTGNNDIIMITVALGKGESLLHASGIGSQFDLRVLKGALFHKSDKTLIGGNPQYTDFFYHLGHLMFMNVANLNILYYKFIEIESENHVEYKTNQK